MTTVRRICRQPTAAANGDHRSLACHFTRATQPPCPCGKKLTGNLGQLLRLTGFFGEGQLDLRQQRQQRPHVHVGLDVAQVAAQSPPQSRDVLGRMNALGVGQRTKALGPRERREHVHHLRDALGKLAGSVGGFHFR